MCFTCTRLKRRWNCCRRFLGYVFLFGGLVAIFRWKYDRAVLALAGLDDIRLPFSLVHSAAC